MAASVKGANPYTQEEWTLGMALRDYFQVPLKDIARELLPIRGMNKEDALAFLEALKVTLVLEGYNIMPMSRDYFQRPIPPIEGEFHKEPIRVIAYPDTPDPYTNDSDGPNYQKDEQLEPLPPQVGFCDSNAGYSVGEAHPAS